MKSPKTRICVITKCDDFCDDLIYLRGNQWRYYYDECPLGKAKRIKMPAFYRGEILLLDEHDREIGSMQRNPYKWGTDRNISKGKCGTEFQFVESLEEAVELIESLEEETSNLAQIER